MSTLTTIFNLVLEVLVIGNQRSKRNKWNQISKEVKLSHFANDMILHIENPKNATKNLLKLINEFSKVTGHKINTQKSLAFLYTIMKNQKEKIRKQFNSPLQ